MSQYLGDRPVPYDEHVSPRAPSEVAIELPASPSRAGQPPRVAAAAAAGYPAAGAVPVPPQGPVAPMPVQPQLPLGAVPYNGGVLFHSNLFANSYRVPGPGGSSYVYYDNSMPMPPVAPGGPPSLREQWHQQTRLLKVFIVLLLLYWLLQWLANWPAALFMPILFLPVYLLWRQWRAHYESVEVYMLVKLFATAFVPGALVVMVVETAVTIVFAFLCFQSAISSFLTPTPGSTPGPSDMDRDDSGRGGGDDAPPGMEFLKFGETPALFVFLFLLSYGSAGLVEESLKYWLINRVKKYRPSYRVIRGYELYALAAALGFSVMENIGYVMSGALQPGGESVLATFFNVLGRTFISTPLHLLTGYLIGLMVIRRDLLGEPLSLFRVMGWSVFWHGSFDFALFVVMVLQSHWSNGNGDDAVSYVLMACIVIVCYTGLAARIWTVRRRIYNRVETPEEIERGGLAEPVRDIEAHSGGHIAAAPSANGFSRIQEEAAEAAV